ncbi:unnamed protein product [Angiostrongylus costaricensis]|uniref:Uncharacterized protein n=1 Tax=Angiostrongylus costaricensis TaxID=334426 RepID=A0A0R3PE68_ANGCS|nr:unnamed protein product [Angiostrongylus costaricensis]
MVTICTYNARTLASECPIEDLLMQARRKGTTSTAWPRKDDATHSTPFMTPEKNCSSEHATVEESAASAFSSTRVCPCINSFEQLTTRIGRLRLKRCASTLASTVFVAYAPTSSHNEEKVEAFYVDLEKFYREDHTFFEVITGGINAKI